MEYLCWYYILFVLSLGWFLLRGIASLIFDGIESSIEVDGDISSDLSGILSFKGLLHFTIGFSTYLSVISFWETKSLYVLYNFTTIQYAWAVLVGLCTTLLLFYLYKLTLKADHYNNEQINFDGMTGKITENHKDGTFHVNVSTNFGVRSVEVKQDTEGTYNVGDFVKLMLDKETNTYYF